jgi:hypothetical protein
MSKTAIITFQENLQGDNITEWLAPTSYTFTNSPYEHFQTNVSTGTTTLVIPTLPKLANYVRILPPTGNSVGITIYQNNTGSNGWTFSQSEAWLPIQPTINGVNTVNLVLTATANVTVDIYFY